jgi:hypothetical protein
MEKADDTSSLVRFFVCGELGPGWKWGLSRVTRPSAFRIVDIVVLLLCASKKWNTDSVSPPEIP